MSTSSEQLEPDYFDKLRQSSNVVRINNLDVILSKDREDYLGFCHLASFLPVTRFNYKNERQSHVQNVNGLSSILLAIRHLNTGDGSVIPEVEGLNERCKIRFTAEFFDTEYKEYTALNNLIKIIGRNPETEQLPCSFLGATRSAVSIPMSIINGIKGYPQISPKSTGSQLDDKSQFKLFGRVIPSDDGTALPIIKYLNQELNVSHLGVLHTDDAYGYGFATSIKKMAKVYAPQMKIRATDIPYNSPSARKIETALGILASSQYRYFFGVITQKTYNDVMSEAYRQGIAGPKYTWIFGDHLSFDTITEQEFEEGSPLAMATAGTSVLAATASVPGMPTYDRYVKAWQSLNNEADIKYIQSKQPTYDNFTLVPLEELFDDPTMLSDGSFIYDAAIATGLGACHASEQDELFNGIDHYKAIINTTFIGSSGNVTFEPSTGSRVPNSALFQLTNFQKNPSDGSGKVTFSTKTVEIFNNGIWEKVSPYIYSDGTTNVPLDIPELVVNYNYLGPSLRAIGLLMCICILLSSGACAGWTYYHRECKVVIASQPTFLYIICFGTFVLGFTILFISIDDEIASADVCSNLCVAASWFFPVGFVIAFGALFSKTWRINKLFYNPALSRIKVTTKDVILPMIILLLANIIVLAIWTGISPPRWIRTISGVDIFDRTIASRGYCYSEKLIPFLVTLILINASAMGLALYQAYLGRHIQTELGETKYIAMAIGSMLLVTAEGIPIMVIVSEKPKAMYFVQMFIIFVVCSSLMLFTFWPKMRFHKAVESGSVSMRNVVREFTRQAINRDSNHSNVYNQKHPNIKLKSFNTTNLTKNQQPSTNNVHHSNQETSNSESSNEINNSHNPQSAHE